MLWKADNFSKCPICVETKFVRRPFKYITNRTTGLLELIHTNLEDCKNTVSRGGKRYYITFIDDISSTTKNKIFIDDYLVMVK